MNDDLRGTLGARREEHERLKKAGEIEPCPS
jgi:hypothetical protein